MAHSKAGKGKNGPSHQRYVSENRRTANKIRRISRCNGEVFLAAWKAKYAR